MALDCPHLFPTLHSVTSYREFKSGHGESIDTMKVSKYYKSGSPSDSPNLVII